MIFLTTLIPRRFDAYTIGPIILLRPTSCNDAGLIAHERTHVRQFWRTLGLAGLLMLTSRKWRLRYELEAYREQLKIDMGKEGIFAMYLSKNYNLNIDFAKAYTLLKTP